MANVTVAEASVALTEGTSANAITINEQNTLVLEEGTSVVVQVVETPVVVIISNNDVTVTPSESSVTSIAGDQGIQGIQGLTGAQGAAGVGVPAGGTDTYLLAKASGADYDTEWVVAPTGVTDHSLLSNLAYASSGHTGFQETLVSGTNLKTINSESLLGSTNISLQAPLVADTDYLVPTTAATTYLKLDASNDPITGALTINTNSTTGLLVEQDGVKDNVLVVDTTNGRVGINTVPSITSHTYLLDGALSTQSEVERVEHVSTGSTQVVTLNAVTFGSYKSHWLEDYSGTSREVMREIIGYHGNHPAYNPRPTYLLQLKDGVGTWKDAIRIRAEEGILNFAAAGGTVSANTAGIAIGVGTVTAPGGYGALISGGIDNTVASGAMVAGGRGNSNSSGASLAINYSYNTGIRAIAIGNWLNTTGTEAINIGTGVVDSTQMLNNVNYSILLGSNNVKYLWLQPTAGYINYDAANIDTIIKGDTATNLFVVDAGLDAVQIGTTVAGAIADFRATTITLKQNTTIGAGAAGVDYTLTFDGETNDGVLSWMEDEDYFKFSDDIMLLGGENLVLDTTTGTKIGTATTQLLGFYNATPVDQPAALSTGLTTITFTEPGTPDYAIADLTQTTPYGFASADEGQTVLKVIANLQAKVAELEARLEELGLIAAN